MTEGTLSLMLRTCRTCGEQYTDDIFSYEMLVQVSYEYPDCDWLQCGEHFVVWDRNLHLYDTEQLFPVEAPC